MVQLCPLTRSVVTQGGRASEQEAAGRHGSTELGRYRVGDRGKALVHGPSGHCGRRATTYAAKVQLPWTTIQIDSRRLNDGLFPLKLFSHSIGGQGNAHFHGTPVGTAGSSPQHIARTALSLGASVQINIALEMYRIPSPNEVGVRGFRSAYSLAPQTMRSG